MNVVFLSQRVPHPPDRGDRISTFHLLRHFRESGARVRVGCLAEDDRDLEAVAAVRSLVAEICAPRIRRRRRKIACLRGLLTGDPLTLPYFDHPELHAAVDRWTSADPPDLVFVYSSGMARYVMARHDLVRVMHFAELDSDKWRQYAANAGPAGRFVYAREARRLLAFEREIARTFAASLVVSEVEKELFRQHIPDVTPIVLPNGVDVDHFRSQGDARREPYTVIFTGVMDYEPNVDGVCWFAHRCWPGIRRRFPDARFLIVGNRPTARVRRLDGTAGITVTGWVEETPSWFDRASVAVAPLRLARGLQNKVLEAMSMGLPVVATPQAARGLGPIGSDVLLVEADAPAIEARVAQLLAAPRTARMIGERAARFVRERFRWEAVFARLDALLAELGVPVPGGTERRA